MKVTVRKVFFKRNMRRSPEQGVMIEKSIHWYFRADRDVYVYDSSNKYSVQLKKLKNAPVNIAYTDFVFEVNLPEEFIKVRCNKEIIVKDMKTPAIVIQRKGKKRVEILLSKYSFLEGEYYYVIRTNERSITLIDQYLKEITFEKKDGALKNFDLNLT